MVNMVNSIFPALWGRSMGVAERKTPVAFALIIKSGLQLLWGL